MFGFHIEKTQGSIDPHPALSACLRAIYSVAASQPAASMTPCHPTHIVHPGDVVGWGLL